MNLATFTLASASVSSSVNPSVLTNNADINNQQGGTINGNGTFELTGTSNYINQTTLSASPGFDTRGINFVFNGDRGTLAATANAPGTGVPYGTSDPFAIGGVDITADSDLQLVNDLGNQSPDDVLFALNFELDPGSLLDLAGTDLWVEGDLMSQLNADILAGLIIDSSDPSFALTADYFSQFGATEIVAPVPEPPSAAVLIPGLIGLFVFLRGSRHPRAFR
jgi:hypothetical protein